MYQGHDYSVSVLLSFLPALCFVSAVLGVEPRALSILGKHPTIEVFFLSSSLGLFIKKSTLPVAGSRRNCLLFALYCIHAASLRTTS